MNDPVITIFGAGNMGRALGAGLARGGKRPDRLVLVDHNADQREAAQALGLTTAADGAPLLDHTDVVVLAIKPQGLATLCAHLKSLLMHRRPLIISVAAGARTTDINRWLGNGFCIIRAMPNTPALIGKGVTVLYGNAQMTNTDQDIAQTILQAVSQVFWINEERLMDAVTAISGSGPAYVFLFIEALIAAATTLGLPPDLATALACETVAGAGQMAATSPLAVTTLRRQVTSPGGTTEKAIDSFLADNFAAMFQRATAAACARSHELGEQLGAQ